jgi:glycosyltransferase involved in cell wall biosynthesis
MAEVEETKVAGIIPNGIDCDNDYNPVLFDRSKQREEIGLRKNQKAVFFIGRLSEEKNPDVFIKTAQKILSTRDDVKFFIIGDGIMRPTIEKQLANINSNNLVYLGYQAQVAKYLSAADIFLLPSSIEGFPLSILEAMAMKVAVVASDVGAVSEVLEKGQAGKVITPGSADEAAASILELVADSKKLNSMKESGRKAVEREFSTKRLGENYTNLYQKALKL